MLGQPRELQDPRDRRLGVHDPERPTMLVALFPEVDEHADAGRIREADPGQVKDETRAAHVVKDPVDLVPQQRCRGHVEIADDRDRRAGRVTTDIDVDATRCLTHPATLPLPRRGPGSDPAATTT
jgi:hypothetical protein